MSNSRSILNKNPISTVMEVARQNPLATVLIGAGCMLLVAEKIRVSPRLPLRRGADDKGVTGAVGRMGRQVTQAADLIGEDLQSVAGKVHDYSAAAVTHAADAAGNATRRLSRTGRRLRGYTRASIQEHPLACLAAGAGFGAAVAALLPATDVEHELLGSAADSLKQKLADAVSEQYQAAKAEAGKAAQEFVWVAAREGLAAVRGASANVSDTGAEVTKSM
jgi:hypothetical protein